MLNATAQQKTLQEMLLADQQAEDDYTNVQRTAREAVGLGGRSFVSGSDTRSASAFPSHAKTTLTRYSQSGGNQSGGGKGDKLQINCFGCDGLHLWSEYIEGKHVVKFPNKSNSGIQETAERNLEKYRAARKKQRTKTSKKRNLVTINLSDFDKSSHQRIW